MPDITMPQLGETVTEGTITKWMKQVGDRVEEDEIIYEISTDKVDSEVPSPVAGFLTEIRVAEGETAEVGAVLAVVSDAPPDGEDRAPAEPAAQQYEPPAPKAQEGEGPSAGGGDPEPTAGTDVAGAAAGPDATGAGGGESAGGGGARAGKADPPAHEADGGRTAEEGGARGEEMPPASSPAEQQPSDGGGDGAKILSPVVRRLISEHGIEPGSITGSGAGGRITRSDVLAVIDRGRSGQGPGPAPASGRAAPDQAAPSPDEAAPEQAPGAARAPAAQAAPAPQRRPAPEAPARAGERDEVVPFTNIRRRTAEHMVRSLATSAHTLVVIEVDYDNVDRVRGANKESFRRQEGISLTYLPFIARATIDAIGDFPHVNASVHDDELIVHRYVNLGIAVDMDFQGLIVPVVSEADSLRLRALARQISDLGRRAKAKKLSADEISGGTFTITNAGGYGTLVTAPIINQPQVAILSTDGIKPRPVAVPLAGGGFGVAVHPVGNLAISFDHRAYDGAYASAFLARIKEILETRDWTAEL